MRPPVPVLAPAVRNIRAHDALHVAHAGGVLHDRGLIQHYHRLRWEALRESCSNGLTCLLKVSDNGLTKTRDRAITVEKRANEPTASSGGPS